MSLSKDMLTKMYDLFSGNDEVTRGELLKAGFSENDVKRLFQKGFLTRSRRGVYTSTNLDENDSVREELLKIGFSENEIKGLVKNDDLARSRDVYTLADAKKIANYYNEELNGECDEDEFYELLKRCYDANPNDIKMARTLLYRKLRRWNFEDIYKYFEATDKNPTDKINNDLFLFLMQYITVLPSKYALRVSRLDVNNLMILDVTGKDYRFENYLRRTIFLEGFSMAYRELKERELDPFYQTVYSLLGIIFKESLESKSRIYGMTEKECHYQEIQEYLSKKKRKLFRYEKSFLKMTEDIIRMDKGDTINYSKYDGTFFSEAVFCGDYDRAYQIFCERHPNKDTKVCKTIVSLFGEIKKKNASSFYRAIITDFSEGDITKALTDVKEYLAALELGEYDNYVSNLIKLAVAENDKSFVEPASALSKIQKGKRTFDTTMYIPDFYVAIGDGDIAKAEIYRDLILESKTLGGPEMNADFFNRALDDLKASKDKVRDIVGSDLVAIDEDKARKSPEEEILASLSDTISDVKESRGLRILERVDNDTRKKVIGVLSKVPNISVSLVDGRVALRYIDLPGEGEATERFYYDLPVLMHDAKAKLSLEKYDEAIDRFSSICSKLERPNRHIYKNLGLCYMKRGSSKDDYDRALDLFYVAQDDGVYVDYYIEKVKEKTDYTGVKVSQYVKK